MAYTVVASIVYKLPDKSSHQASTSYVLALAVLKGNKAVAPSPVDTGTDYSYASYHPKSAPWADSASTKSATVAGMVWSLINKERHTQA